MVKFSRVKPKWNSMNENQTHSFPLDPMLLGT